ncbi:hypothetical protein V8E36_009882 [Tilletia maclaganii]
MPPSRNLRDASPAEGDYRAMLSSVTVLSSRVSKREREAGESEELDDEDLDPFSDLENDMDLDGNDDPDQLQNPGMIPWETECTEMDIQAVKNLHLRTFVRAFGLVRRLLEPLETSIQSFEAATPSDELQVCEDSGVRFAHLHQVMMLALPMVAMQKAQHAMDIAHESAQTLGTEMTKLVTAVADITSAQDLKVKDPTLLRAVVAAFFYSGQAPGYACGSKEEPGASKILENKAMYFQQHPNELGADGEDLMSKPAGQKAVRPLVKKKLHSLRNVTKDRLAQSIGFFEQQQPWNLLELAKQLYSNADLAITPLRLYRLSFLRTAAASKKIYFKAEHTDSRGKVTTKWVANPNFWAEVDKELKPLMRDLSSADAKTSKAANQALRDMYLNDQAKYGKFAFDMGAGGERKKQELDKHLAQTSKGPAKRKTGPGKIYVVEADESDLEIDDAERHSPAAMHPANPLPAPPRPSARPVSTSHPAGPSTSLPSNAGDSMSGVGSASRVRTASPDLILPAAGIVIPSRESIDTAARVARNNGISTISTPESRPAPHTPAPGPAVSSSVTASSSQLLKLRSGRKSGRPT